MQIYFAHDFFRSDCGAGDPDRNSRWLHALLAPQLADLGHQIRRLSESDIPRVVLSPETKGPASWAQLFSDPAKLSVVQAACAAFRQCDLVIGFEMTPNQLRFLHAAGTAFIDVSIDPVRFAPDLFLQIRTNHQGLECALKAHEQTAAAFQPHIARVQAEVAAQPTRDGTEPAVLFVGQTDIDASLVCGAKLIDAAAFIGEIARLADGRRLLLKPHPYGRAHRDIRTLRQAFQATVVSDNIYALLGSPCIEHVITLSSGVAEEARLFGKPVTKLITSDNTRERLGHHLVSRNYRVSLEVLGSAFWRALDGDLPPPGLALPPRVTPASGRLRRSVGQSWGYTTAPRLSRHALRVGQRMSFAKGGDGLDLCTLGWSTPERTGTWTDGSLATMLVNTQGTALDLILKGHVFIPSGYGPLRIMICTSPDVTVVQHLTFHVAPWVQLVIPLPAARGYTEVQFHLSGTTRPVDVGVSNDTRDIGLHLVEGLLRLHQKEHAAMSSLIRATQCIGHNTRRVASRLTAAFSVNN